MKSLPTLEQLTKKHYLALVAKYWNSGVPKGAHMALAASRAQRQQKLLGAAHLCRALAAGKRFVLEPGNLDLTQFCPQPSHPNEFRNYHFAQPALVLTPL